MERRRAASSGGGAELSSEQNMLTRTDAGKRYSKLLPALVKQELREQGEDGKEKQFWRPMGRYRLLQKGVNPKLFGGGGIDELVEKNEGEEEEEEEEGDEEKGEKEEKGEGGEEGTRVAESTTVTLQPTQLTILETLAESDEEDDQHTSEQTASKPVSLILFTYSPTVIHEVHIRIYKFTYKYILYTLTNNNLPGTSIITNLNKIYFFLIEIDN